MAPGLFWKELPVGRVIHLRGASPEAIAMSIDPLRDGMPAIVTYYPELEESLSDTVGSVLSNLDQVVMRLWPAWLPGAEQLSGVGGTVIAAARALAIKLAHSTDHFGPFLADLAEHSLRGLVSGPAGFAPEVRAPGLAKIIATAFHRSHMALLVYPPVAISPHVARTLADSYEWLAHHGGFSVWLTGVLPDAFDRFQTVHVTIDHDVQSAPPVECEAPVVIRYPPLAGRPHPGSKAEQALEAALAACDWARGRIWNHTFQPHALANPIRVDLLWVEEHCIVEVDGPDHWDPLKFEADRRRDVELQLQGFAVLRFTNSQILSDVSSVRSQIERFIQSRRSAKQNGGERDG
jgi:very-short-patch-repair endonuclease